MPDKTLPPPRPQDRVSDNPVVAYMQWRRQRNNQIAAWIVGAALVVVLVGGGAWQYVQGQRAEDRFHERQVCMFSGYDDC